MVTLIHFSRKPSCTILVLLVYIMMTGCKTSSKESKWDHAQEIDIPSASKKLVEVYLSQLKIKHQEEIKLNPTKGLSFVNIGSVQVLNDRILVTDKTTSSIFIFDKSGRCISSVNSGVTKNGGQIFIGRTMQNSDRIGLLNNATKTIRFYDLNGDLVSSKVMDTKYLDFISIDSTAYFEFYPQPLNLFNKGYSFRKISANYKPIIQFMPNPIIDIKNSFSYYNIRPFMDSVTYWEYRSNRIFHISQKGDIVLKFRIELGPDQLSFDGIVSPVTLNTRSMKTLSVTRIVESRNHIYMESVDHGLVFFFIYDKSTKQLTRLKDLQKDRQGFSIGDDLFNGPPFVPFDVTADGYFFSVEKLHKEIDKTADSLILNDKNKKNVQNPAIYNAVIRIMKY